MYVKNAVVNMDWEVEGFFETHDDGFVAASQIYETPTGTHAVLFKDRVACFLIDSETGQPATRDELTKALKSLLQQGMLNDPLEDVFPEEYAEIGMQGCLTNEDILDTYGFSDEQKQDVINRMDDLDNYYEETVETPF